jgi:hypothetical protein
MCRLKAPSEGKIRRDKRGQQEQQTSFQLIPVAGMAGRGPPVADSTWSRVSLGLPAGLVRRLEQTGKASQKLRAVLFPLTVITVVA